MAEVITEGLSTSKDYEIRSLELFSSSGKASVSLEPQFVEMELHQSIHAPVMFGSLVIVDGQDLFYNFFMNGNELLKVAIDQPSLKQPLEKTFRIYKVANRSSNNNAGSKYVVYFASPELLLSNSQIISKAYKGARCSDAAKDILQNFLKVTKFNVEDTSSPMDIIVPSYRPIEALHWLASRSFSGTSNFNYYFFENRDGFQFVSLQKLYQQPSLKKKLVYDLKSVNDKPNSPTDLVRNRNSIEKLTIINDFDVISTAAKGGFASKLMTLNLLSQQYKFYDYSVETAEKNLLNKNIPTNDTALTKSYPLNYKLHIATTELSDQKDNSVDKWLMQRQMHNALIDNFKLRAVLAGDVLMKAGDIVSFDMPKFIAADEKGKQLDEFRSGKYLLQSVTHVFRQNRTFDTILEMVSDSVAQPLPAGRNNSKAPT